MLDPVSLATPQSQSFRAFVNERSSDRWLFHSDQKVKHSSANVSLNTRDHAAFLACIKRDGHTQSRILRTFVEAIVEGRPYPKPQQLIRGGGKVMIWSILPSELYSRAMEIAHADGYNVTAILRGYLLAYIREDVEGEGEAYKAAEADKAAT
jgi:hypothetical protein